MYKTLSLSILSTIVIGCSSTTALKHFDKSEFESKAMQYTKKADVIINKEQKVLLWGTYLNNTDITEFDSKDEVFVTSIYFVEEKSQDINENGYFFTLNGKKSKSIEEIQTDNEKYKDILSKNTWGKYYLVKFNEVKDSYDLTFTFSNTNSNSAELKFEK
jgi:hypothetical protein